jgi:valyl-tRNA synthetase
VLAYALDVTLRLLHPVMPFVTDELGRALRDVDTITLGPWPQERPGDLDERAEAGMTDVQEVIAAVRRFRAEHAVPPSRHPRLRIVPTDPGQAELLAAERDSLVRLARLEAVEIAPSERAGVGPEGAAEGAGGAAEGAGGAAGGARSGDGADGSGPAAKLLAAGAELYLPLSGLLDLDEERERLAKERDALQTEARRAEAKVANPDFVAKAPAAVVEKARERLAEVERARAKVAEQIQELTATTGG